MSTHDLFSAAPFSSLPPFNIAVLVPLSGPHKKLGQNIIDAIELALLQLNNEALTIIPFDTQGDSFAASQAAQDALDQNIDIILGPVFSTTTQAVMKTLKNQTIPVISFSNDSRLADSGALIFGVSPEQQMYQMIDYAIHAADIKKFATIMPNSLYGATLSKAIRKTVNAFDDANIIKTEIYPINDRGQAIDITRHIDLAYQAFMSNTASSKQKESSASLSDFAFVIGATGEDLEKITSYFADKKQNSALPQLIGTSQWYQTKFLNDPILQGAWFATIPMDRFQSYQEQFYKKYHYTSEQIASVAYDAIFLVATLHALAPEEKLSYHSFMNDRGFIGVNGAFHFTAAGISERNFAVVEIRPEGFTALLSPHDRFSYNSSTD